jgi:hypothetical protein
MRFRRSSTTNNPLRTNTARGPIDFSCAIPCQKSLLENSLMQHGAHILGILRLRAHHPLGTKFGAALRSGLRIG